MKIWKVLNARTLQQLVHGAATWYVAGGRPRIRDFAIRGTFLVVLDDEVLTSRLDDVAYWSPVDLGGVAAGMSTISASPDSLKGDADSLRRLLAASSDPVVRDAVSEHQPLERSLLFSLLSVDAANSILSADTDAHSWLYEICFHRWRPVTASEKFTIYRPREARHFTKSLLRGFGANRFIEIESPLTLDQLEVK